MTPHFFFFFFISDITKPSSYSDIWNCVNLHLPQNKVMLGMQNSIYLGYEEVLSMFNHAHQTIKFAFPCGLLTKRIERRTMKKSWIHCLQLRSAAIRF